MIAWIIYDKSGQGSCLVIIDGGESPMMNVPGESVESGKEARGKLEVFDSYVKSLSSISTFMFC